MASGGPGLSPAPFPSTWPRAVTSRPHSNRDVYKPEAFPRPGRMRCMLGLVVVPGRGSGSWRLLLPGGTAGRGGGVQPKWAGPRKWKRRRGRGSKTSLWAAPSRHVRVSVSARGRGLPCDAAARGDSDRKRPPAGRKCGTGGEAERGIGPLPTPKLSGRGWGRCWGRGIACACVVRWCAPLWCLHMRGAQRWGAGM